MSGTGPLVEPPALNRSLGGCGVGDAEALLCGDAVVVGGGIMVVVGGGVMVFLLGRASQALPSSGLGSSSSRP
jgi:hypothetical protein